MREAYEVIVAPVLSEKSTRQIDTANTYTFKVAGDANKIEIAQAVEKLFDVTVTNVRTMNYAGKMRRAFLGRMSKSKEIGRRASFKKAVVTLSEGDQIEFYEVG
jgi:large subunit ribosomal protein L23